MATDLSTIFRGGGYLVGARMTAQVSRLIYILIIVRALGPDLYGMFIYLHAWGLIFLPLFNMGSQALLSRAFGQSFKQGKILAQQLWTIRLLSTPILMIVLIGLGIASESDNSIHALFFIVGIALAGRGFALWSNHILIANHLSDRVLKIEAVFRFSEVIIAAIILHFGAGVVELLSIHAIVWCLQAVISIKWVTSKLVRPVWCWKDINVLALLRQSFAMIIVAMTLFTLMQGPVVLGRHLLGIDAELGYLALAMQIIQVFIAFPNAIGIAALPILAGTKAKAGTNNIGKHYLQIVVPVSIIVALTLAGIIAIVGDVILSFLFGIQYVDTQPILTKALFMLLVPLTPAVLLSQAALASTNKNALKNAAFTAFLSLVISLVAVWGSIYTLGMEGILVGAGIGALSWLLLLIRLHIYYARTAK